MKSSKKNKRQGPDLLVRSKETMIFISWIMFFAIFMLVSLAKPQTGGLLPGFYNASMSSAWDSGKLQVAFLLMICLAIMSVFGLFVNSLRIRRKGDGYSFSFIVFGAISLIGIILYPIIS